MSSLPLKLGLVTKLGLPRTIGLGGGGVSVIVTQTIMRDSLIMRDNLRMTDNAAYH